MCTLKWACNHPQVHGRPDFMHDCCWMCIFDVLVSLHRMDHFSKSTYYMCHDVYCKRMTKIYFHDTSRPLDVTTQFRLTEEAFKHRSTTTKQDCCNQARQRNDTTTQKADQILEQPRHPGLNLDRANHWKVETASIGVHEL